MNDPCDKKLCKVKKDCLMENLESYLELVREPQWVCRKCGRVAASEKRLCKPAPMYPESV